MTRLPTRPLTLGALALALVAAACVGTSTDSSPRAISSDAATVAPSDAAPTDAAPASASIEPDATEPPATDPPATEAPSAEPGSGPAAACSGTDENRSFFASVAEAVDWSVYCPVLGDGWFVDAGQYRLAGGGWLEIAFRGPGGARIDLHEGAACTTSGCVSSGTEVGAADFGDLDGTLLDLGGGRSAVVVDPGATPSWTFVGTGLSQADVRTIAADLALVEG